MKKLTLFVALFLSFVGYTAKAQDEEDLLIYISGAFNGYNPDGDFQWALFPDEDDEVVYSGYFEIPAGQLSFNFQYAFGYIVPGVRADEEIEPAGANVEVFTDGDTFFNGPVAVTGISNLYWEKEDWEGGTLEVMIDSYNEEVILIAEGEVLDVFYLSGAFNNYQPDALPQWTLYPLEDEDFGVYSGTFTIPEDQLTFNLTNANGFTFVPFNDAWEAESVEFEFTDGEYVYSGVLDYAFTPEEEECVWSCPSWTGGDVTVTLNLNEGTLALVASGTNGIESIGSANAVEVIYNLNGMRVDRNRIGKGVYIVNGKKVIF